MAYDANTTLKTSGAETASANGVTLDLKTGTPRRALKARIAVSAVTGTTPTLVVAIQTSTDNATWVTQFQSVQITATGVYFVTFETSARYVRYASTVGGTTPSFTYSVGVGLSRP